jgi:NAD(P)-dependent dehydrogenase (short-subunit alcohol dehydrogenase family)
MTKQLGRDNGITINTIAPGPVNTDGFPTAAPQLQQLLDMFLGMTRAEVRTGTVNDIGDVALFLASEKSRWITGQWLSVSGGITGL